MTHPAPAAFVESMIDANGVRIRCRAAGDGETLVVLHGPQEPAPSGALGLIAASRRVVAIEVPQGDATTAAAAIAALGSARHALWGHGAAAGLALSVAMAQPETVEAVVLVAPAALDDLAARDDTFVPRLKDLATPALALFGTEDRIAPCESAHRYRTAMTNCSVVMVYDAGHAIDTDRPEAVASVVDDFLARHEGFLVRRTSGLIHP
ncbi:MAG: alpha/beta fold hydrolase [Rhodospirillales bacterium]